MVVQQDAGLAVPAPQRELKRRAQAGHPSPHDCQIAFLDRFQLVQINRELTVENAVRRLYHFRRIAVRMTVRADPAVPIPVVAQRQHKRIGNRLPICRSSTRRQSGARAGRHPVHEVASRYVRTEP